MRCSERNSNRVVFNAIRAIVGADGMRDLLAEKGGTEIWIPRECDGDHWMSRLLGEDVANRVCEHFAVIDADGHVVGNVRCVLPLQNSRLEALHQQIEEEVKQALLAGKMVRDIVREVGIHERHVRRHLKFLRESGVLPTPAKPHARRDTGNNGCSKGERKRIRAEKLTKVDAMLIAGRTTRSIVLAASVGAPVVRTRRKQLLDNGRLHVGERAGSSLYRTADSVHDAIGRVEQLEQHRDLDEPDEVGP